MIQGQFDAATKFDTLKPHDSTVGLSREHTERPSKRRRTSPPIEDSINVVDLGQSQRPSALHRRASIDTAKPRDEQVSPVRNNEIDAADQGQDETSLQVTVQTEPADLERVEENGQDSPSDLDQTWLSNDSFLTRSLPPSNVTIRTATSRTEIEAPGPPHVSPDPKNVKNVPQENGTAESAVVLSRSSSRPHSPAPSTARSSPQDPRTSGRFFHLPNGLKQSQHLDSSRNAVTSSSGPSTPKPSHSATQTNSTSSPLSSPPPELFDPYDEQSTEPPPSSSRPSSPVSDNDGQSNSSDEGGPTLSQEHVNRSQTLRRSLSTLKGRELFDASIWSDPLKTSVFYTFATNLRQKSKDAAPTGCHEFISHLSNAGKMVRCYTQNIDLLEDKVGLSTRLLLGPGSRSRFSTRLSKGAAGTATPRNPNLNCSPPSNVADSPCVSSQLSASSEPVVKDEDKPSTANSLVNTGEAPSQSTTNVNLMRQEEKVDYHEATEDSTELGRDAAQHQGQEGDADRTTNDVQPAEASTINSNQPTPKPDSGHAVPEHDRGVECVFLHGSLRSLRCFQCGSVADWDEGDRQHLTLSGEQPPCPRCEYATAARQERGKRALGVGKLRPDIVLYGEEHPESQRISTIIQHDISLAPDMLIIMGTSLKVHGLKTVVREFAKAVHNKKDGKVIFINFTKPAESVWADTIDFWVEMDCDAWVQDLKAKKPVIWLPPGSVDDEPRNPKRRRTIKAEGDKKPSKKAKNTEQVKGVIQTAHAPDDKEKKLPKALAQEGSSDIKKPEPKRPAATRDCRQNAAYWTTKIMLELAKLSGRKEWPTLMPRSSKSTLAPQNIVPATAMNNLATQKTVQRPETAKIRRGPRTKNTKSRRKLGGRSTTSKARTKPPGKAISPTRPSAGNFGTSTINIQPERSETLQSGASMFPKPPTEEIGSGTSSLDIGPSETSGATILAEVPIPNLGPETENTKPGTSIRDSVKSHPRIRKPKKIFGASASETESGSNAKSKLKNASQARKTKASAKSGQDKEAGGADANGSSTISPTDPTRTLPAPPPRLQPISATSAHQTSQREDTPVGFCYNLPPLRHADRQCQPKHNLQAVEPIIEPGPPAEISPSLPSPNHWRNCAFIYRDPLSRHFDNYYPQSRPPLNMVDPAIQASMLSHQQQRTDAYGAADPPSLLEGQHATSDELSLGPTLSKGDDSPSQQLHREFRDEEAAVALNKLRSQVVHDTRQFTNVPERL